jgi:hypothetical protein
MKDDAARPEEHPVTHGKVPGHRRGSSPRFQDPGETLNEQGKPLPPHLQTDQGSTTTHHAPRHPRAKRIGPIDAGLDLPVPTNLFPMGRIPQ